MVLRIPAALVVAAAMLVAGGTARASGLPLKPLPGGLWTVAVDTSATDGAREAPRWHFLVDTGSTHTVLGEATAARAGLAVRRGGRLLLTPGGLLEVGEARLPMLRLGERVRRDVAVLVADLSALGRDPRIDGILGMDVLDADRVVLDLAAGALTLLDGAAARVAGRGTSLPARVVGGRLVVEARVDGRPRDLVLDTGAAITVLYDDAGTGDGVRLDTAGGSREGRTSRAELSVGGLHLGAVIAVRVGAPHALATGEGLLPAQVFTRIEVDRHAGVVRVVPRR